jgi:N-acetylneuraminic acid mutarotase
MEPNTKYSFTVVFIVSMIVTINAQTVPTTVEEIFGNGNYIINNNPGAPGLRAGSWTQGSNMPFPRYYAASVMYSQSDTSWLYVFGGDTTGSGVATSACLKYNLNTDTWNYIASLPEPMRVNSAAIAGDKIYVFGGFNGPAPSLSISSFYEYDIATNSWRQLPDLPVSLFFSGAESYEDSLIYIFGGITDTGTVSSENPIDIFRRQVFYFNLDEEEFREATDMPEATASFGHVRVGAKFYITAGLQSTTELWDLNMEGEVDPVDKSNINWTLKANYPLQVYASYNYTKLDNKRFCALGGSNTTGFTPINSAYQYDIEMNNFMQKQTLPINLMAASGGYTNTLSRAPDEEFIQKVVLAGGVTNGPALSAQTWVFTDTVTVLGLNDHGVKPVGYSLNQNYPNPFNPSTTIQFSIPEQAFVKLEIFNTLGEKVDVLLNEELNAGTYEYKWNAKNLTNGIYYYSLTSENFRQTKKLILLK